MSTAEFEAKKRQREEEAEAKTAKNRAKRQKKKERSKGKAGDKEDTQAHSNGASEARGEAPLKKKRLVNESAVAFNQAADHDDDEDSGHEEVSEQRTTVQEAISSTATDAPAVRTIEEPRITIHDDE